MKNLILSLVITLSSMTAFAGPNASAVFDAMNPELQKDVTAPGNKGMGFTYYEKKAGGLTCLRTVHTYNESFEPYTNCQMFMDFRQDKEIYDSLMIPAVEGVKKVGAMICSKTTQMYNGAPTSIYACTM